MLTAAQTVDVVLESIEHAYLHPFMYGETAASIEGVLQVFHELWATILEKEIDYRRVRSTVQAEELAYADLFSNNYARAHPQSTEIERIEYAISRWRKIDKLLGLPMGNMTDQVQ